MKSFMLQFHWRVRDQRPNNAEASHEAAIVGCTVASYAFTMSLVTTGLNSTHSFHRVEKTHFGMHVHIVYPLYNQGLPLHKKMIACKVVIRIVIRKHLV